MLSVLAVAAIVALSITVAVYDKRILDFMDRHESEWYNLTTTDATTKFWDDGKLTGEVGVGDHQASKHHCRNHEVRCVAADD